MSPRSSSYERFTLDVDFSTQFENYQTTQVLPATLGVEDVVIYPVPSEDPRDAPTYEPRTIESIERGSNRNSAFRVKFEEDDFARYQSPTQKMTKVIK
jgi:hypothetical protein